MPPLRIFALVLGVIYTIIGLMGLLNIGTTPLPEAGSTSMGETSLLLGAFAVDPLHNIVHIITGLAGLAVGLMSWTASRTYAQVVGVVFLVLFLVGLISQETVVADLVALNGADDILHILTAAVGLYFGFVYTPRERMV
jgi:small-conductance mechanosensitive channel